jgi:hypothetical protein
LTSLIKYTSKNNDRKDTLLFRALTCRSSKIKNVPGITLKNKKYLQEIEDGIFQINNGIDNFGYLHSEKKGVSVNSDITILQRIITDYGNE